MRLNLRQLGAYVVAFVWAWSGCAKLMNWDSFVRAVEGHGILPLELLNLAWVVPITEILLAIALVPDRRAGTTGRCVGVARVTALVSVVAALALSVYAWRIPAAALETVGCGCRGGVSHPMMFAGLPARPALLLSDAVFLCAHWLLFAGVVRTRPTPAASSPIEATTDQAPDPA